MHRPFPPANEPPEIGWAEGMPDPEHLLAGRTPDGRRPELPSHVLYTKWEQAIPGDEKAQHPLAKPLSELKLAIDMEALDALSEVQQTLMLHMREGRRVLQGGEPLPGIKADQVLRLGHSSAAALPKIISMRRALMHEVADRSAEADIRQAFREDRAHAVVAGTLLALEEAFEQVGFGSWMPFRYPDQWLMFCGVMRRVLAANGLIHARDPEVYRRLLEETPPVEAEEDEKPHSPRRLPRSWSRCHANRGAQSMQELRARLQHETPRDCALTARAR